VKGTLCTFTVTYDDDAAVDVGTLGSTDIMVTGPNGFSQYATFLSVDNGTNGTPRTATYQITPAGGSWNMPDNGTYTITLRSNEVSDIVRNFIPAETLGTFSVNVPDTVAPFATLSASNITTMGSTTYNFTVTYADDVGIDTSTLGSTDIQVTGPNGYSQTATIVSVNNAVNGTPRTATYQITAPSGSAWSTADAGTYSVAIMQGEVTDTSGNP